MRVAGVEPNTVTYTALLKSCCSQEDMAEASALLAEMEERQVEVNGRTVNTFLRGCVRVGDVDRALKVFEAFVARVGMEQAERVSSALC